MATPEEKQIDTHPKMEWQNNLFLKEYFGGKSSGDELQDKTL